MRFFKHKRFWIILGSAGLLTGSLAAGLAFGLPRNGHNNANSNTTFTYTKSDENGTTVEEYRSIPYQTDMTVEANKTKYDFVAVEKTGYLPVEKQFDNLDTSLDVDTQDLKKTYYYGVDSHNSDLKPITYNIHYKLTPIPAAREASGLTKNITVYYEKPYSDDFTKVLEEIKPTKYDTYNEWSAAKILDSTNKELTTEQALVASNLKFKVSFNARPDKNHTGSTIYYEVFFNTTTETKTEEINSELQAKETFQSIYGVLPTFDDFTLPTIAGYKWVNQVVFEPSETSQLTYGRYKYVNPLQLNAGETYKAKFLGVIENNYVSSNKYIWYTVNCVVSPALTVQKTPILWENGVAPFGASTVYQLPYLFPNKERNYENWTIKSVSPSIDGGVSLDPTLAIGEIITVEFEAKPDQNHIGENAIQTAKFKVISKPKAQNNKKTIIENVVPKEFAYKSTTGIEEVVWQDKDLVAGCLQWTNKPVQYIAKNGRWTFNETDLGSLRLGTEFYAIYSAAPDKDLYSNSTIAYKAVLYKVV